MHHVQQMWLQNTNGDMDCIPCTDEFRRTLRGKIWSLLKRDDPDLLMQALHYGACGSSMTVEDLCIRLKDWLWKNDNNGHRKKTRGLVAVAASNIRGVQPSGSLACLRVLLQTFPPGSPVCSKEEIEHAWCKCENMGRTDAMQLLQMHWDHHNCVH